MTRQLIGIARPDYAAPYAQALEQLGTEAALVVSGEEGLDEVSGAGPTVTISVGSLSVPNRIAPEDAGLPRHAIAAIRGGDPEYNAAALRRLLAGEHGAYRDAVLLNAAAALMVAARATDLVEGVAHAAEALDSGAANALLARWIAYRFAGAIFSHDRILETKRAEVAARKATTPLADLDAAIARQSPPRGFRAALDAKAAMGHALIAEIKKASPSKGLIREDFDPPAHARAYRGGSARVPCRSLTDHESWFPGCGQLSYRRARPCNLPVLRKDFMPIDPWQVPEIAGDRRRRDPAHYHGRARRRAARRDRGERDPNAAWTCL